MIKKVFLFACFFLLMISTGISDPADSEPLQNSPELPINDNPDAIIGQAAQAGVDAGRQGLFGIGATGDASPILLPNIITTPTRILFNVESGESIGIDYFIVLICLFLFVVIMCNEMFSLSTFKRSTVMIISLAMTIILSLLGVLNSVAQKIFSFGKSVSILALIPSWIYVLTLIGILIILLISWKYLKVYIKRAQRQKRKDKAYMKGVKSRLNQENINALANTVTDNNS